MNPETLDDFGGDGIPTTGPDLNRAIALLLGWKPWSHPGADLWPMQLLPPSAKDHSRNLRPAPDYCTDAFPLLEWLDRQEWVSSIEIQRRQSWPRVTINTTERDKAGTSFSYSGQSDTLAVATARAFYTAITLCKEARR